MFYFDYSFINIYIKKNSRLSLNLNNLPYFCGYSNKYKNNHDPIVLYLQRI